MSLAREILLTLQAARLFWKAQALRRGRSVPETLEALCRTPALPRAVGELEAQRVVRRAASRLARLGLTNTCLIRSLVLATLLADREEVRVHLGFEPVSDWTKALRGHAWVSLHGQSLPDPSAATVDGEPCAEIASLSARRPGANP